MKIGILGGGQLGRMLALAGYPLGMQFLFLEPSPESPAGQVGPLIQAGYEDREALTRLAQECDVVTYEFENVPAETAHFLMQHVPVYPPPQALATAQDRLSEKKLFRHIGLETPPFFPIETRAELEMALAEVGYPAILKTRRFGYDGKGQALLKKPADCESAWQHLGGVPLILEGFVRFDRELSLVAVRNPAGAMAFYPLVENHHRNGILRRSQAPIADLGEELQKKAEEYAQNLMNRLDYVGVLAIEFFQCGSELLGNEMACRVHNSGHWSIEGAETSQFENHLRAIAGWPLGATHCRGASVMFNLIGEVPEPLRLLSQPHAHLHLYGKEPRPGRKLGHVTCRADHPDLLAEVMAHVQGWIGEQP